MSELSARVDAIAERAKAKRREVRQVEALAVEQRLADQAAKRDELRVAMPQVAAVVDEFKRVFGEGVRVLAAQESGKTVLNRRAMDRFCLEVKRYE